ncbi:tripartite tricarboxylate transporter substrate binding protein [Pigmentiphaga soli]|uniref:Tripartite tricarboxylate transporter substrate binding protein n=1 Tax=Pigmentiphaga soli TaxID=1007095 RepID=A0ABP8H4F6_9BURK
MKKQAMFARGAAAVAVLLSLACGAAAAQDYPNRPVRSIVGYPPGGAVDTNARILGQALSKLWGQSVVIENRGGAGSTIGTAMAAQAAPDGYAYLVVSPAHAINATLYKKLPYDTEKDFAPVAQLTESPLILFVNPSLPVNSVAELIAYAKAHPGKLNYGSSGNGTSVHLAGALFNMMAGTRMTHIPYNGGGPAYNALLAGDVDLMFGGVEGLPHAKSGKLKALAVTTPRRAPGYADIPTVAESGLPGYEVEAWYGVYVPAATPKDIVARLNRDINRALETDEVRKRYGELGFSVVHGTPEQFAEFSKSEIAKWRKVVQFANAGID